MFNSNLSISFQARPEGSDRNRIKSMMMGIDDDRAIKIVNELPALSVMPDDKKSNLTVRLAEELSDLRVQSILYQQTGEPKHLKYVIDTAKAIDKLSFNRE